MKRSSRFVFLGFLGWFVCCLWSEGRIARGSEPITHSVFIAGPTWTGILDEEGKESWTAPKAAARDGFVLENGHVLIAWAEDVQELDRAGNVVFHYQKAAENGEISTAQRLENGHTLIAELGASPRLLEVDSQAKVLATVPLLPETDNTHMQTRMARKLPNGNYLVPHLLAFQVKEYAPNGDVVRSFSTDRPELGGRAAETWPFTAIRLPNGHTVVTLTHGNQVIELDAKGEIVWRVTNDDLPGRPLKDPCGAQRLPNGNTVICSYAANEGVKLLEVTPENRIVWTYEGPHRAHEVQVLTTNGTAVQYPPMK